MTAFRIPVPVAPGAQPGRYDVGHSLVENGSRGWKASTADDVSSEVRLYAEFCLLRRNEGGSHLSGSAIARALERPTRCRPPGEGRGSGQLHADILLGLAPRGVCTAVPVARHAVSSYLAISPLPSAQGGGRYPFCCTFRRLSGRRTGRRLGLGAQPLTGTLPCGVRTFLPGSQGAEATARRTPDDSDRRNSVKGRFC